MGIVYLIHPAELKNTSVYKVGFSNQESLARCQKGYKKGS